MGLDAPQISTAVERYEREYELYARLADRLAELCRIEIVDANAIRGQVTFRAKSPRSLQDKLRRRRAELACVDDAFSKIRDLAGVRIATYAAEDEPRAIRALMQRFAGPRGYGAPSLEYRDKCDQDATNFYRAAHVTVTLQAADVVGEAAGLTGVPCEIQVCTLMASVWNEIEHDVRYKHAAGSASAEERELLRRLGQWTRAGDELVTQLLSATASRQRARSGEFEDVHDFVTRMRARFAGVDIARHAGPLFDALIELGLNAPGELAPTLGESPADAARRTAAAREDLRRFAAWLRARHETRCALDEDSSDLLLVQLFGRYAAQLSEPYGARRNSAGRSRIAWLARRFLACSGQPSR
jgi:ppGpp synthetase/RelA/SpoT-type nucleotidyltranferase